MPTRSIALALGLFVWICAESACSRSDPAPPGLRETLKTWNAEAAERTAEDVLPWYQANTEDEVKLARSFAAQTVATARLAKAVRTKWGHDTETAIMHLCLTDTPEDDATAIVTVAGPRANLNFGALQIAPLYFINIKGVWRMDMAQYITGYGPRLQSTIKYCDRSSEAYEKLTASINSGEVSTARDAVNAVKAALAAIAAQP